MIRQGDFIQRKMKLGHALDELVDVLLAVTELATLDEVVALLVESLGGGVELEGPEETVNLKKSQNEQ